MSRPGARSSSFGASETNAVRAGNGDGGAPAWRLSKGNACPAGGAPTPARAPLPVHAFAANVVTQSQRRGLLVNTACAHTRKPGDTMLPRTGCPPEAGLPGGGGRQAAASSELLRPHDSGGDGPASCPLGCQEGLAESAPAGSRPGRDQSAQGGAPRCARLINRNQQRVQEPALLEAALSPEGVDIKCGGWYSS